MNCAKEAEAVHQSLPRPSEILVDFYYDASGGKRFTPGKCCGRWREQHAWDLTPELCEEIIEDVKAAKKELEDE